MHVLRVAVGITQYKVVEPISDCGLKEELRVDKKLPRQIAKRRDLLVPDCDPKWPLPDQGIHSPLCRATLDTVVQTRTSAATAGIEHRLMSAEIAVCDMAKLVATSLPLLLKRARW